MPAWNSERVGPRVTWALMAMLIVGLSVEAARAETLDTAVRHGDLTTVRRLLQEGADANGSEADGTTVLHRAAESGRADLVGALLAAGASARSVNRYGVSVLEVACEQGSIEVVERLLDAGADPNAAPHGEPPVMTAARTGEVSVVRLLVARGARVNEPERWQGETALMWAAIENHADMVRALAALGADVNARASVTTLAQRPGIPSKGFVQIPRGAMTALMFAAREDAREAATALLDAGAKVDYQDPGGVTALLAAVHNGHLQMAEILLARGASPSDGSLYVAVEMRSLKTNDVRPIPTREEMGDTLRLIRRLLELGAAVDAPLTRELQARIVGFARPRYVTEMTPLLRAARSRDVAAMELLLAHGADARRRADDGMTVVMAAIEGDESLDDFDFGGHGRLAYRQATPRDTLESVAAALTRGADVNAADRQGVTALHLAARHGADELVSWLARHGARVAARDKAGRTPLDEALGASQRATLVVGRLSLPSGVPAAGAQVTLTDISAGVETSVLTDRDGLYQFPPLAPGHTYRVVGRKDGVVLAQYDDVSVHPLHPSTYELLSGLLARRP